MLRVPRRELALRLQWRRASFGPLPPTSFARQVVKVFVDNPFPIPLIQHACGVRCLDVSPTRSHLALVDEASKVVVYDIESKV